MRSLTPRVGEATPCMRRRGGGRVGGRRARSTMHEQHDASLRQKRDGLSAYRHGLIIRARGSLTVRVLGEPARSRQSSCHATDLPRQLESTRRPRYCRDVQRLQF